jgi:putative ABC transport system permease protein
MLSDVVEQETASRAGQIRMLGSFAAVAVLLAAVGIHGLLAFAVSQRTHEFGVRIALGAQPAHLARMVLRQGAFLAMAGSVPGLFLAYAAGKSLQGLLAGVGPGDPVTFASVVVLTIGMTIAGCFVPALRVLRVNSVEALRADV